MIFLLFFILFVGKSSAIDAPGSCVKFSNSTLSVLNNTCAAAVNYPYFLPLQFSRSDYDALVLEKLNDLTFKFLPAKCQEALVGYICSTAYLKCHPNIDLTNIATYNFMLYQPLTVPVPFQRPCKDVCTNVQTKCAGTLFGALASYPDCDASFDYTNGQAPAASTAVGMKQYDASNDGDICYRTKSITVAETAEMNIGYFDGPCKGISDPTIISAPGNKIKTFFSVIQPPYLIQTLVDMEVKTIFSQLPLFLSRDCSLALKKYICSLTHVTAKQVTLGYEFKKFGFSDAQLDYIQARYNLTNAVVALPQNAEKQVCIDYRNKCADFLTLANDAKLTPNCSAKDGSLYTFPEKNQTIIPLPLEVSGQIYVVPLSVTPFVYSSSVDTNYQYKTSCPTGYVVPEDTSEKNIVYVSGTGCALACP
jgi:hypothetical protein